MPNKLPTYYGWTVDYKLKEFRKVLTVNGHPKLVVEPFTSDFGDALLARMIELGVVPKKKLVDLF